MSHHIQGHPDVDSGFLDKFSSYKIERNTKTVIANILKQFFSKYSTAYKMVAPEIIEVENSIQSTKLFIEKEFPFYERRLPFIAVMTRNKKERKAFLGGDDFVYSQVIKNDIGEVVARNSMYGNMYDVPVTLSVAATSPETRMQIAELISLCFTHFYRWVYMYKDIDGSLFNIVPNQGTVAISDESTIADNNTVTLIHTCVVTMLASVEYIFVNIADNFSKFSVTGFEFPGESISSSTGTYVVSSTGGYLINNNGVFYVTSTGTYTQTSTGEFILSSSGEYVIDATGEFVITNGPQHGSIIW